MGIFELALGGSHAPVIANHQCGSNSFRNGFSSFGLDVLDLSSLLDGARQPMPEFYYVKTRPEHFVSASYSGQTFSDNLNESEVIHFLGMTEIQNVAG